jgi:hypothetical protein
MVGSLILKMILLVTIRGKLEHSGEKEHYKNTLS